MYRLKADNPFYLYSIPCNNVFFISIFRNLFAYSSTDRLIYLRQFATKGSDMKLVATMKGHVSEVAKVSTSYTIMVSLLSN